MVHLIDQTICSQLYRKLSNVHLFNSWYKILLSLSLFEHLFLRYAPNNKQTDKQTNKQTNKQQMDLNNQLSDGVGNKYS